MQEEIEENITDPLNLIPGPQVKNPCCNTHDIIVGIS